MFAASSPLESPEHLEEAFLGGLRRLLEGQALSGYILCAANAAADPAIRQALEPALSEQGRLQARRHAGGESDAGEEDRAVFAQMLALGEAAMAPTRIRHAGPFEVQFNRLRALRPPRVSRLAPDSLYRPFDPDGFHFNRPFMLAERYWEGQIDGRSAAFYFNKYPFARYHTLLVPEREAGHPQYLDAATLEWAWRLLASAAEALPDLLLAYNAFGAYASVNHLHFHLLRREAPLPAMGAAAWPVVRHEFDSPAAAWSAIARLHEAEIGYNLLLAPGRLWLFVRRRQGEVPAPPWSSGFTWYEMAGGFVTPRQADFETLTAEAIETAMRRHRVEWP